MSVFNDRFAGITRLYGVEGAESIRQAHVCIVGVGGVGSWAAEAIARSGVGEITLIDMDDICVSNVNRQIQAKDGAIGQLKVEALGKRFREINPELKIHEVMDFITPSNMAEMITSSFDFVIDAIDSATPKAALIAHCKRNKIPLITTGAAGGQSDPTKIEIADLNKTTNDPLAKKVRSLLRRHHNYSRNPKRTYGVSCVYSTEQLRYPQPDGSVCQQKSTMENGVRLDCSGGFGAVTMVTATFGMVAASKVIEKIANQNKSK